MTLVSGVVLLGPIQSMYYTDTLVFRLCICIIFPVDLTGLLQLPCYFQVCFF